MTTPPPPGRAVPKFWLTVFGAAALIGAFGTPANGWQYLLAAALAGATFVHLLRPHLNRNS